MVVDITGSTDHAFIDHELSASLDSNNVFEGPEKLLEIWFYPFEEAIPERKNGLRSLDVAQWISMLKLINCELLSVKRTRKMDAFLLSESSMFVYEHRITLKTCGTTTTLLGIVKLLELVEQHLGWELPRGDGGKYHPYKVFYSRRRFMFPLKQRSVHRSWEEEVSYINSFFCHGNSYVVGPSNQNDHWNLFVTDTNKELDSLEGPSDFDETLEILMTGLDPVCAQQFVGGRKLDGLAAPKDNCDNTGHSIGMEMTRTAKLDAIYSKDPSVPFVQDAFAFTPCGYSSNMMLDDIYYYNLHITPEKDWSYASFESNVPVSSVWQGEETHFSILLKVLDIFKPANYCVTLLIKSSMSESIFSSMKAFNNVPNYQKRDKIIHDLEDYQVLYLRYQRIQ